MLKEILESIGRFFGKLLDKLIVLVKLLFSRIISWFREREALVKEDADNLAFTIKQSLENGKVKFVQGIFNKKTNEIKDAEQFEAEKLDKKLEDAHRGQDLVIYN